MIVKYNSYPYRNLLNSPFRHDVYTLQHSISVANISKRVAQQLGVDLKGIEPLYCGALIHDIGKLKIPQSILRKPGKLTAEEYEIMKEHPEAGWNLIKKTSD